MLYQVDTGAGLIGVKYINADSEDEAIEKTKDMLYHPDEGLRVIKINRNEQITNNLIERLK